MIDFRLTGRRAFVTGCASGIGLATAERLARSGAHVAMNDLPGDRLELAVGRLRQEGLSVEAMPGDLGVSASARLVAQQAVTLLGGLDYLVNNAGAPLTRSPIARSDLVALTDDFWDRILRVNLMSVFWMIQALAPQLRAAGGCGGQHGVGGGLRRRRRQYGVCDRQGRLVGLTQELARGLAPQVRVNGIAPAFVNSPWKCSFGDIDAAATVPLARVGQPADYAEVIVYLCAGATYITGEVIPVTGGLRI